jgi:hypothetical protein
MNTMKCIAAPFLGAACMVCQLVLMCSNSNKYNDRQFFTHQLKRTRTHARTHAHTRTHSYNQTHTKLRGCLNYVHESTATLDAKVPYCASERDQIMLTRAGAQWSVIGMPSLLLHPHIQQMRCSADDAVPQIKYPMPARAQCAVEWVHDCSYYCDWYRDDAPQARK